jgi:TRAP-type uncharacterized transport system substrate-binding protein
MHPPEPAAHRAADWRGKAVLRFILLLAAAAAVAGLAANFGIAYDYGYLRASILTGVPDGRYNMTGLRLAERAKRERGSLTVVSTQGSVENVSRLIADRTRCREMFALVQDGTLVPKDARLELLGRLPEPESLLLLGKRDRNLGVLAELRGLSVGIGPEGSGTAHLVSLLFEDPDLQSLNARLSKHTYAEQAELVAQGRLDLAAVVMADDSPLLRAMIRDHDLDLVAPRDLEGLVTRHPWLALGRIPAGRFDLVRLTPPVDKPVAHVDTLVLASPCANRAERIALLMLLAAEFPGFVRGNPPKSNSSATALPLAAEARQYFVSGEPELADRYFPWLVNLMSPAYWVYLVMAITVLFNAMRGYSRFRLWRIDARREKLEARFEQLTGPGLTREQIRALPVERVLGDPRARTSAREIVNQLIELRGRCQQQNRSIFTPMGEEIYYRYQESLINELVSTVTALLERLPRSVSLEKAPEQEAAQVPA